MLFPKPKRVKDRALLDQSHTTQCLCCSNLSDPAHIKSKGSGGHDTPENILDLCRKHHSEQHSLGWDRFAKKHPAVWIALTRKGWVINSFGNLVKA